MVQNPIHGGFHESFLLCLSLARWNQVTDIPEGDLEGEFHRGKHEKQENVPPQDIGHEEDGTRSLFRSFLGLAIFKTQYRIK